MSSTTYQLTREDALRQRGWKIIDAEGVVLGRLATRVADLLRGKGKPTFTPNVDCGDFVIVINADRVVLTGNKETDKVYYRHTGYPGGIRSQRAEEVRAQRPESLVRSAVKGMLPRNRLGKALGSKLKIYGGAEHPHRAQMPETITIGEGLSA